MSADGRGLRGRAADLGVDAFLTLFSLAMLLPLVLLVANAFKTPQEMLAWPPTIIPRAPTLDNVAAVLRDTPLLLWV